MAVDRIDFCGHFELHPCFLCNLDGTVGTLFRRDSTQESEIVTWIMTRGAKIHRQSMIDVADPIDIAQRLTLCLRNGNQRLAREVPIKRSQIWKIEAAMESGYCGESQIARGRKVGVIRMEMQDVKIISLIEHLV